MVASRAVTRTGRDRRTRPAGRPRPLERAAARCETSPPHVPPSPPSQERNYAKLAAAAAASSSSAAAAAAAAAGGAMAGWIPAPAGGRGAWAGPVGGGAASMAAAGALGDSGGGAGGGRGGVLKLLRGAKWACPVAWSASLPGDSDGDD